jgi:hypothetical protein
MHSLSKKVMKLMKRSNRQTTFLEMDYIMNMSKGTFLTYLRNGHIPVFPLKPMDDDATPIPSIFYCKKDWLYNNRHLLEYYSVEAFVELGSHVDFIFRETARAVDLDMYFDKLRDLATLIP